MARTHSGAGTKSSTWMKVLAAREDPGAISSILLLQEKSIATTPISRLLSFFFVENLSGLSHLGSRLYLPGQALRMRSIVCLVNSRAAAAMWRAIARPTAKKSGRSLLIK